MAIYLTHGAKKNVGDYLIHNRARKIWSHLRPEAEIVSVPRWEKQELPERAQALILCGGPGFTPRMVESVFPIAQNALEQEIPVSGLALGWQGLPARNPGSFAMTARSVAALRSLNASGAPISVRDSVTQEIAEQLGISTVLTGCTAWYSLPHLDVTPSPPKTYETIVFTTPASTGNTSESILLMRALRDQFPKAKLIASFHRGIKKDDLTPAAQSRSLRKQAFAARRLGYEVRDTSYDLEKIGFYREADLHVGYRVHAHLDFVSRRMPSMLISEDGRGYGQTATLHGNKQVLWAGSKDLVHKVTTRLERETKRGWPTLSAAAEMIEATWPTMQQVIAEQARLLPAHHTTS